VRNLEPVRGPAPPRSTSILPRSFNDAQQVADRFKDGVPVILNLQSADAELSKRLIDFASGLTYALDGGMQRIADKVFLLTPQRRRAVGRGPGADARARLLQPGIGEGASRRRTTPNGRVSHVHAARRRDFERRDVHQRLPSACTGS
jgi:hypothetical protein